jgi:hypothetical protein
MMRKKKEREKRGEKALFLQEKRWRSFLPKEEAGRRLGARAADDRRLLELWKRAERRRAPLLELWFPL